MQRGNADADLTRGLVLAVGLDAIGQIGEPAVLHVSERVAGQVEQRLRGVIALGVDGGVVENAPALRHAQEACALLEGLGTELWHFLDLRA